MWPDALRRGLQGEVDTAEDVAALLDDASVAIRRKAAEVTFDLAVADVLPQARRALERDEDETVKSWAALALVRMGDTPGDRARALVHDGDRTWRRAAALAFALRGDPRGKAELAAWWHEEGPPRPGLTWPEPRSCSRPSPAFATRTPSRRSSPRSTTSRSARASPRRSAGSATLAPARRLSRSSRRSATRPRARSRLVRCSHWAQGGRSWPLAVFAGLPDPMTEAVTIAVEGKLLDARRGGAVFDPPAVDVDTRIGASDSGPLRLWVLAAGEGGEL